MDDADTGALPSIALGDLASASRVSSSDTARSVVRRTDAELKQCAHLTRARRRRQRAQVQAKINDLTTHLVHYLSEAFGSFLPPESADRIAQRAVAEYVAPLYARRSAPHVEIETLLSDVDNEVIRQRECMIEYACPAKERCLHGNECSPEWLVGTRYTKARDRHLVHRAFGSGITVEAVREGLIALRLRRPKLPTDQLQYLAVSYYLDKMEQQDEESTRFSWDEAALELSRRNSQYMFGDITAESVRIAVVDFSKSLEVT